MTHNVWNFPLKDWTGNIPLDNHPGAFGAYRKYDRHTGVDLYVSGEEAVFAVEHGIVVAIEDFTGPKADSPWWLPTKSIMIEGMSGVVCYGEVEPFNIFEGDTITTGQIIAHVAPVLYPGKEKYNIVKHSRYMLHFEYYKPKTKKCVWWHSNNECPTELLNPTVKLLQAYKMSVKH
jgi:hypothetical protein